MATTLGITFSAIVETSMPFPTEAVDVRLRDSVVGADVVEAASVVVFISASSFLIWFPAIP